MSRVHWHCTDLVRGLPDTGEKLNRYRFSTFAKKRPPTSRFDQRQKQKNEAPRSICKNEVKAPEKAYSDQKSPSLTITLLLFLTGLKTPQRAGKCAPVPKSVVAKVFAYIRVKATLFLRSVGLATSLQTRNIHTAKYERALRKGTVSRSGRAALSINWWFYHRFSLSASHIHR
jgi:hypothetical protein